VRHGRRRAVVEGGALLGPRVARTFDPNSVAEVKKHRTTVKSPRDELILVGRDGSETTLFHGDAAVAREHERVRGFFLDRSARSLSVRLAPNILFSVVLLVASVALIGASMAFAVLAFRARARFRISILRAQGLLRIERVVGGSPRDPRDVPLAEIVGVSVENEGGASGALSPGPARVVVHTRLDADVYISPRFFIGPNVHAELATELRRELGLPSV